MLHIGESRTTSGVQLRFLWVGHHRMLLGTETPRRLRPRRGRNICARSSGRDSHGPHRGPTEKQLPMSQQARLRRAGAGSPHLVPPPPHRRKADAPTTHARRPAWASGGNGTRRHARPALVATSRARNVAGRPLPTNRADGVGWGEPLPTLWGVPPPERDERLLLRSTVGARCNALPPPPGAAVASGAIGPSSTLERPEQNAPPQTIKPRKSRSSSPLVYKECREQFDSAPSNVCISDHRSGRARPMVCAHTYKAAKPLVHK